MRRTVCTLLCLCLCFLSAPALAKDVKIGVIDLQDVLEKSDPGQKAIDELKGEFKDVKSKLDKKKQAIDELKQQIQKQSLMLSQEAQMDKEMEYRQKVRDFQDLYKSYQQKMKLKEKKLREPIIDELVKVVKDYGQEHGYTVILDKRNSGVIFNADAVEITNTIIVQLNKAWDEKQKASGN
jgi:outer membrane protein